MWSKPAEAAVLGSMMRDNTCIPEVMAVIGEDDFFLPLHREIYHKIMTEYLANRPVDQTLLDGKTCDAKYLDEIAIEGYSPSIVEYYAKEVKRKARYRQVLLAVDQIKKMLDPNADVGEMITKIQGVILDVGNDWDSGSCVKAMDVAGRVIGDLHKGEVFIPTGFINIDAIIKGFKKGELIVLAGRPGTGKSALILNIIQRLAYRSLIITLEMKDSELVMRALGSAAEVDLSSKDIDEDAYARLWGAAYEMGNWRIDDSAYTVDAQQALIRRWKPDVVVIDHVGLMSGPGRSKLEMVTEISRRMKQMAKAEDVVIVLLSQLNRQVEGRESRIPTMSDLRDSGALEQDADMVWLLSRKNYYDKLAPGDPDYDPEVRLRIEKFRRGRPGIAELLFDERYVRFVDKKEKF